MAKCNCAVILCTVDFYILMLSYNLVSDVYDANVTFNNNLYGDSKIDTFIILVFPNMWLD